MRQGRAAPDQADIDPKALKRLLPFVFLLDARPEGGFVYRLAGTTLCERYGTELRGKNFMAHWDTDSRNRLDGLLRQSLASNLPLCLTSVGATEDCRMIEIETVLMPITYGSEQAERYLGIAQVLTDVSPLIGRSITFERLVSSALVREDETLTTIELPPSAPPPPRAVNEDGQRHPRAPHLRLVVSHQGNAAARRDVLQMDSHETLQKLFDLCGATASYQGQ
ncbi:MAG: hypothetical protein RJB62_568 [Pseudomonadota bacterium]